MKLEVSLHDANIAYTPMTIVGHSVCIPRSDWGYVYYMIQSLLVNRMVNRMVALVLGGSISLESFRKDQKSRNFILFLHPPTKTGRCLVDSGLFRNLQTLSGQTEK